MTLEGRHTDILHESWHGTIYYFALTTLANKGQSILDVGIGDGAPIRRAHIWLGDQTSIIIGTDINPLILTSLPKELRILPACANGLHLPFKDHLFPLTISSEVIEHLFIDQHAAFVEELVRVTQPGGSVVIATPNADFLYNIKGHTDHKSEFNTIAATDFARFCQQYGNVELYVLIPSQRFIKAQSRRAKMWFVRPIRGYIPRVISEIGLTILTRGQIRADMDMKDDFRIEQYQELQDRKLFTDFIFIITKA